ncbi:MAG: MopE-related protein [Saprospiraceae bacterium]
MCPARLPATTFFTTNTVTLTVYDASGNQSTCTTTVTVKDETAPDLVCKNHSVGLGANGSATIAPADVHQSSSDNCGMVNLVSVSPSWLGCNNVGPNTVTLTANDGHGNTQTCMATVTVADGMAPDAHCKNATVVLGADGNGSLAASSVDNYSSDNCGIGSMAVSPNTFTCAEVGANTVTLTVTDNNNNTGTCTATVTVEDSTAPTANCTAPTVQITLGPNAEYTIDPADLNDGSSDACGIQSLSASPSQLSCQNEGANTVTLTVADSSGNTGTCNATVEVASFLTINSIVSTNETCVGFADGSITISATSGGGQIGYSIDGGANFQLVSNTFALLTPGTYNIVVKVFGIPGVCEKTGVATVGAGSGQVTWYKDSDGDGYSDGNTVTACSQPAGYIANPLAGTDCNDNNASIHPGATEICDGLDNDCNGSIPASETDNDGDGYRACDGDCNDSNPDIHPGAAEVCNGLDDNCDGSVDEGLSGETYTGNVAFYTQAQVDAWPPCYSVINGNVMINGAGVNNLGPLSNITEITGNLTVQTTGLTSMTGLNSLVEIGGTVTIFFNSSLTTLDGLEALNSVGGSLYIYYNFQLNDCCAIYNLVNGGVTGPMVIFYNKVGCNSVVEINSNCQNAPLVGGSGNSTLNSQAAILVEERSLSVYPNPATDVVTVLFDPVATTALLEIRGGLGHLVFVETLGVGADRLDIDLNNQEFANGIYFITLMENGQKSTHKLVVQH